MTQNFGTPPTGATVAQNMAQWVEEVRNSPTQETIRVPWRGSYIQLPVVSVPVSQLYLNPNTHRIRAQRSSDAARDAALEQHPWGDDGQLYLSHLLRAKPTEPNETDPEYNELVDELRRHGQQVPGIVTRAGVLVDANTRCVALRELGEQYIRVGALPETANWDDINTIELQIQLRKDKRRDYPYINRLISIEEQLQAGMTERDVGADWNIAEKSLKADRWAYGLILEAIERSTTDDGARLTLLHFNDQQESLREFHRHYTGLAGTNPDAAEQLREARLAALVLGLPKTSLRFVQGDFYTRYLERQLPSELKPEPSALASFQIPGLPDADPVSSSGDDGARRAKELTDLLLRARAQITAGTDPHKAGRSVRLVDDADEAFRRAAKLAGQDVTLLKKQTAVPDRIIDASDYISQGSDEFAKSRAERTLDADAFDSALLELRTAMERLARQAARAFSDPGEGVAWLLNSVRPTEGRDA